MGRHPALVLIQHHASDPGWHSAMGGVRRACRAPVVLLQADHDPHVRAEAYRHGADEVIGLPCSEAELRRRVACHLDHSMAKSLWVFLAPMGLQLDYEMQTARLNGCELLLTPSEFKLLGYLARRSGDIVPKLELIGLLGGPSTESDGTSTLETHLSRLRKKMRGCAPGCDPIEAINRVGYRFNP
ncbi:MAG: winged helix-turn-helix domain-containing protein [Candidatus Sumerlaeia bacterium]|nr:winged helix-turn-helix domain-containing protein [Candidatus Sumerlaeia bacterium]